MSSIEIIQQSAPPDNDRKRQRIREGLWSCIHSSLITDESSQRLMDACGDDPTFNLNTLARSLEQAITFDVRPVRQNTSYFHIRITVNMNRIKNHIGDRIGHRLHAMTRRRSPDAIPPLGFLDELARASTNEMITFSFQTDTNTVNNIHTITKKTRHRSWLQNVLLRAIDQFNGSIWFMEDSTNE